MTVLKLPELVLIATATVLALIAGLFFSYSISVSLGLGKLSDLEYIKSMQHINREIQNPIFFICFFSVPLLLSWSSILYFSDSKMMFTLLLAATIIYIIGVFGITVVANVPLNDHLDKLDLASSSEILSSQRNYFEKNWNFWNHIRSIASFLSVLLVVAAGVLGRAK